MGNGLSTTSETAAVCRHPCAIVECGLHRAHVQGQRSSVPCPVLAARIMMSDITARSDTPAS
jgi:hypothetical protein